MDYQHPVEVQTDAYRRLEADLDWTTIEEKALFFAELKGYGEEKGYAPGWAARKYKDRFLEWPSDRRVRNAPTQACGNLTLIWIKATMQDCWRQRKRPTR